MKKEEIMNLAKSLKAEIVETHISWVLLTKKIAYKIKKPLKTSFLDFSTLAKRKKFCRIELELNQKLSPTIYLEVVGIQKSMETFLIVSEEEKAVEYAVKMKRMNASKQMEEMLLKNKVQESHIKSLAKAIASFHLRTPVVKKWKTAKDMVNEFKDLLTVKKAMDEYLGSDVGKQTEEVVNKVSVFLNKNCDLFLERVKKGFVRECHADLHSGNIFLYKQPILFDRIEFNESFRHIDVLHEIGFLCMDLEAHGKKKLSKQLLRDYLEFAGMNFGDKENLIFNYYKCYTANVRAKVNLIGAKHEVNNKKYLVEARKYLGIMFKYADKLDV